MSDQLTAEELAYIANWLSKPEVRTALITLVKLFVSIPPTHVPLAHIRQQGGADMVGGGINSNAP